MKRTYRRLAYLAALSTLPVILGWCMAEKRSWLPEVRRMYGEPVQTLTFSADGQQLVTTAQIQTFEGKTTFAHALSSDSLIPLRRTLKTVATNGYVVYSPDLKCKALVVPQLVEHNHTLILQDYRVEIRDAANSALIWKSNFSLHVGDIAFSPYGSWAFVPTGAGTSLIALRTGQTVALKQPSLPQPLSWEESHLFAPAFAPDERSLAVRNNTYEAQIYDVATGRCRFTLHRSLQQKFWEGTDQAAFSPDSTLLAEAYREPYISIWDAKTGKLRHLLTTTPTALAFSPNSRTLAMGDAKGAIHLWDARTGDRLRTITPPPHQNDAAFEVTLPGPSSASRVLTEAITVLVWSPDGSVLVSGDDRGYVTRWRIK